MSSGAERVPRKLAAIFAADVASYSRLMSADETATLRTLTAYREIMDRLIAQHGGRIANTAGDSVLAEFPSVVDAIECAVLVQEKLREASAGVPEEKALRFRIGVHVGDVMVRDGDLFGDGVNVAARVQALADPGSVCLSGRAYEEVEGKLEHRFEDRGDQQVKNIRRPVRVVALVGQTSSPSRLYDEVKALPLPDMPSIAVLPFSNLSGDPEQEYFADGIVEDIITALSRYKWLFVIARASSFLYRGKGVDIRQVGRDLGVRYVLEGSVRRASQRLRITGELIDAHTGSQIWSDRFDGSAEDMFDLQDQISANVANALGVKLEEHEIKRTKQNPTDSLSAYDFLLRARAAYRGSIWRPAGGIADVEQAHRLLLRALALDPEFALAHAAAGFSSCIRKANNWVADEAQNMAEADAFARAAGRLGRDDPVALCTAGHTLALVVRDLDAGSNYTDRALSLAPNFAVANLYGSFVCVWRGETELAIKRLERAMRLSPLDPMLFAMKAIMAHAHYHAERYGEAARWAEASLSDQPTDIVAARIAAASYAMAGKTGEAERVVSALRRLNPALRVSNVHQALGPYGPDAVSRYEEGLRKAGLPE